MIGKGLMKRKSVILMAVAALGGGALLALVITLVQQQAQLHPIQAGLTRSPVASPVAMSPSPTAAGPSPTIDISPSTGSAFSILTQVTDDLGHTWVKHDTSSAVQIPASTRVTFTTLAQDPLGRSMEYAYTTGGPPGGVLILLCDWGVSSCTWTAPVGSDTNVITAYVRAKNGPGRTPCGVGINLGACDDTLTFFIYPSSSPVPVLNPGAGPGFAYLSWVTDNLGHTWVRGDWSQPDPVHPVVTVTANSNVTFKATGGSCCNWPVEYAFTAKVSDPLIAETVLCAWGGDSCSWTFAPAPQSVGIRVYVRVVGAPHRLTNTGAFDSSDGWTELPFQVASS